MGNENCRGDKGFLLFNTLSPSQIIKENSAEQKIRCFCAQDVGYGTEEIDEGSPFSKFDIRFLKTSVRASRIQKVQGKSGNSESLKDNESMRSIKQKKKLLDVRKTLIQWSQISITQTGQQRINSQESHGESQKFKAIREYSNFLLKIEEQSKFEDIKMSGESLYKVRYQPISLHYQMQRKLGQGSFGCVYIGKCIKSGQLRAIKVIKKKSMNAKDQKLLLSEINILKKMDHINIIKMYDVFCYNNFFYVVTQYCEGGTLLEALRQNSIRQQKQAVVIMKQIVSAVRYMHQMKIAHRDLKLENIMLIKQAQVQNSCIKRKIIKIIDFGLACRVNYTFRNKSGLVGTIDYMAPEIFLGYFSCNSDVWSCGIILCMLLSGVNPFRKKQTQATILAIKQQQLEFTKPQWRKISKKAIDLLTLMLNKKQEKRINIEQVIMHPWFKVVKEKEVGEVNSLMVIRNFNEFNRGNNFMCFIKNFLISRELSQQIRLQMALIFERIDTDSSGVLEKKQLMALYSLVTGVTDDLIQKIIDRIDQNQSGRIDFQEFLICMTQAQLMKNQEYIDRAFDYLDEDRTGFIQKKQLVDCLQGCEEAQFRKIIKDLDGDGDGKISREQFRNYLMKQQF